MKILLLSAVVGLLWGLRVGAEIGTQPNFDANKFSGMWNIIVMGSNDKVFLSKKDSMKMATAMVTPASNGDLNIKFGFPNPKGGCQIIDSVFVKGAVPGQFSDADFNQKKIHVVKTDYKRYAILYMQVERDGVTSNMLQLYTRGKDLVAEAVLKMQMLGPKLKLYPHQGRLLPKTDVCIKALTQPGLRRVEKSGLFQVAFLYLPIEVAISSVVDKIEEWKR
ncbi:lipocalin-15-like [Ornithorhynchus anatinus]|uniref:lipocalin-15-like n=1 Tax=Ornithorhynchus anatinus TaxID=9258 RepID=UPI0019D4151A|nr:lipocalin-15-like [Ornithorhynchus anatinus]